MVGSDPLSLLQDLTTVSVVGGLKSTYGDAVVRDQDIRRAFNKRRCAASVCSIFLASGSAFGAVTFGLSVPWQV